MLRAPVSHFRKGITLIQLFRMFPDEEPVTEWIEPPSGTVKVSGVDSFKPLGGSSVGLYFIVYFTALSLQLIFQVYLEKIGTIRLRSNGQNRL